MLEIIYASLSFASVIIGLSLVITSKYNKDTSDKINNSIPQNLKG